jgi:hypothetical protein
MVKQPAASMFVAQHCLYGHQGSQGVNVPRAHALAGLACLLLHLVGSVSSSSCSCAGSSGSCGSDTGLDGMMRVCVQRLQVGQSLTCAKTTSVPFGAGRVPLTDRLRRLELAKQGLATKVGCHKPAFGSTLLLHCGRCNMLEQAALDTDLQACCVLMLPACRLPSTQVYQCSSQLFDRRLSCDCRLQTYAQQAPTTTTAAQEGLAQARSKTALGAECPVTQPTAWPQPSTLCTRPALPTVHWTWPWAPTP